MTPARSQLVLLGGTLLSTGLSLALTALAGRSLSSASFGTFAMFTAVLALAHELTDLGTGNLAARQATRSPGAERAALGQLLGLRLLLGLVGGVAVGALAAVQADHLLRGLLVGAAVVVVAVGLVSAFHLAFQLRQALLAPTVLQVAVQALALMGAGLLLLLSTPWPWWAALLLLREAMQAGGLLLLARRRLGTLPRPCLDRAGLAAFHGSAGLVALATLGFHLQVHGGVFTLQALAPPEELGRFAAAQRLLLPGFILPWLLAVPLVPVLAWLAPRDRIAFQRQARNALDLAAGLGAVTAVALAQLAEPALLLFYGQSGIAAAPVLCWLALAIGCAFPIAVLSPVLLADRAERALLALSLAGLLANLVLLGRLVPRLGATGAAIAVATSLLLLSAGGSVLVWQRVGLLPGGRSFLALVPAALLWQLLSWLPGSPAMQLTLAVPLVVLAALPLLRLPGLRAGRAEQAALAREVAVIAHG